MRRPRQSANHVEHDKGHGRIERREVSVIREVDWLFGDRHFPGELRLPSVACLVQVKAWTERAGQAHSETRYFISSAPLDAARAAIGGSRTNCIGCSMSRLRRISPVCVRDSAPATGPSCAILP